MAFLIVVTVAWFAGIGAYAAVLRAKEADARLRGQATQSMTFLLEDIDARLVDSDARSWASRQVDRTLR